MRKLWRALRTLFSAALARLSSKVEPEIHDERKAACESCTFVDMKHRRMFRITDGRPTCGTPADPRVTGFKLLRDPEFDGCGCWLDEKWKYKGQKCPLGRWKR